MTAVTISWKQHSSEAFFEECCSSISPNERYEEPSLFSTKRLKSIEKSRNIFIIKDLNLKISLWGILWLFDGILKVLGFWNWRILDDGILSGRILRLTGYWVARFLGLTGYWARRNFWEWRNIKGGIFEIDEILSATGFLKLTGYWVAGFWEWRDFEWQDY